MSTGIAAKAFAGLLRERTATGMHREDCRGCGERCGRFCTEVGTCCPECGAKRVKR